MNVPVRNLSDTLLHLDILKDQLAEARAERDAARAGESRAVEALGKLSEQVAISAQDSFGTCEEWLDSFRLEAPDECAAYEESVAVLSGTQPALDWLDQREREAVAKWIEQEAWKTRRTMGEYYERSVEGLLEEAAVLRAGKGGE